jgi:hypothetical protein
MDGAYAALAGAVILQAVRDLGSRNRERRENAERFFSESRRADLDCWATLAGFNPDSLRQRLLQRIEQQAA